MSNPVESAGRVNDLVQDYLDEHADGGSDDHKGAAVQDLITDILHWAQINGLDAGGIDSAAWQRFWEERP